MAPACAAPDAAHAVAARPVALRAAWPLVVRRAAPAADQAAHDVLAALAGDQRVHGVPVAPAVALGAHGAVVAVG